MSLVGSLEDLGLVDILQIVSLSRKSGRLELRSEAGEGRILLRNGLVHGAMLKGGPADLRGLLIGAGLIAADAADSADAAAAISEAGIDAERVDALRREHVERVVMSMLGWRSGEFSFEICDGSSGDDAGLALESGLNPQYLAMEATRLGDEADDSDASVPDAAGDGDAWDPVFSGEDATDVVARRAAEHAGADAAPECEAPLDVAVGGEASDPVEVPVASPQQAAPATRPMIAIDSDLSALEWLKATVAERVGRVHIFQRTEIALDRIRQYLARGEVPIVVVADSPELARFVARLRGLAPAMPILGLRPDHGAAHAPSGSDGVLVRPSCPSADPDRWHLYHAVADRLRADLEPWLRGTRSVSARRRASGALARLKRVSERLRDPSTQGEVMTLVLDFAAESFARVALFMRRDDATIGMAQHGFERDGGPDDDALRALVLAEDETPELFAEAIERRHALRGPFDRPRERRLVERLGGAAVGEAYVAPLESAGCAVALVFATTGSDAGALPDTTALEIVLAEAGLALERTVLERALAERA